jgi:hypothetical protein
MSDIALALLGTAAKTTQANTIKDAMLTNTFFFMLSSDQGGSNCRCRTTTPSVAYSAGYEFASKFCANLNKISEYLNDANNTHAASFTGYV